MKYSLVFDILLILLLFSEEYIPGAARLGMEWQYFVGNCSDPAVQQEAKKNFIIGFNQVFGAGDPEYCQKEKTCEMDNIIITCGATQRRKRRNVQVSESGEHKTESLITVYPCIPRPEKKGSYFVIPT